MALYYSLARENSANLRFTSFANFAAPQKMPPRRVPILLWHRAGPGYDDILQYETILNSMELG